MSEGLQDALNDARPAGMRLVGLEVASQSDAGRVRSANQDRCAAVASPNGRRLLVVADGMGGHRAGEVAAQIVVDTCAELLERAAGSLQATARDLLVWSNQRILERAAADPALRGMGATGIVLLLDPAGQVCVAHVGDSRAYRIRESSIEPLTEDHSLVASLVRAYQLDPSAAGTHPRRNELLRSLGAVRDVEVDVQSFALEPRDRFLICSDGLWSLVSDAEMLDAVAASHPAHAAQALVDLANARGGRDNITVQIAVPQLDIAAVPARPSPPESRRRLVLVLGAVVALLALSVGCLLRLGGLF